MSIKYNDDFLSFDDPLKNERLVVSVNPLRLSEVVVTTLDCVIEADVIIVDRPVDAAGKSMKIHCREIHFLEGSRVASTGATGTPDFSQGIKPVGSQDAGSVGADGANGGNGMPGGNIEISCEKIYGKAIVSAMGGQGGRGQDGGDGVTGGTGSAGAVISFDRDTTHAPPIHAYSGGNGRRGGAVGLPGKNGNGGSRGSIRFLSFTAPAVGCDCKVGEGDSGANALPGNVGAGGQGGGSGALYEFWYTGGPMSVAQTSDASDSSSPSKDLALLSAQKLLAEWSRSEAIAVSSVNFPDIPGRDPGPRDPPVRRHQRKVGDGNPGLDGDKGESRDAEVSASQGFLAGIVNDALIEVASAERIGSLCSEAFLEMQVAALEDEFRSSGLEVDDAFWGRVNFYLAISEVSSNPVVKGFFSRLCSMARKVQLGLDFFGFSKEYVPLLAMATYRELLDRTILDQVRFIEQQYDIYVSKLEKRDDLLTGLRQVRDGARGQAITLVSLRTALELDITKLGATIPALNASVEDAYQQLLVGRDKLELAFKRKTANGCGFVETLITATVLVAGVAATGGSVLAFAGATGKFVEIWNENNKSVSTLWDAKTLLGDGLKPIESAGNDVLGGIKKIQQAYDSLSADQKNRQLPALTIERDKFDQIAKDFADLPEAAAYKSLGYAYLDRIESRNKAVLDYNAQLIRLMELIHVIQAAKAVEAVAEDAVRGSVDMAAPIVFTRLKRIRRATLDSAAQLIHAQEKAMGYHFGVQKSPRVSARNAAEIAAAHAAVNFSWIRAKESYIPIKKLISGAFRIPLKQYSAPQDWARFISVSLPTGKRPLHLSIDVRDLVPTSLLISFPGLRITGARLLLDGIALKNNEQIGWVMYQDGRESLLTQSGEIVRFTRLPRPALSGIVSTTDVVDSDNSENGLYSGSSIFATWRLVISDPGKTIDFKKLKDLVLAVDGYYTAA